MSDMDDETVGMIRHHAKTITGGNCAFADDDLRILAHLAQRAVNAGLTDKLQQDIQAKIKAIQIEGESYE